MGEGLLFPNKRQMRPEVSAGSTDWERVIGEAHCYQQGVILELDLVESCVETV